MLERFKEINMLLDFYADLLTAKQRYALEMYYSEDLSLAEIAENISISRQGVHDLIKRSIKLLKDYEAKLNLVTRYQRRQKMINEIVQLIDISQPHGDQIIQLLRNLDEQEE